MAKHAAVDPATYTMPLSLQDERENAFPLL